MSDLIEGLQRLSQEGLWYTLLFAVVFITLILNFIEKRVLRHLYSRLKATGNIWDDAMVDALGRPLRLLTWTLGITAALYIIDIKTDSHLVASSLPLRDLALVTLIAWFLWRLVNNVRSNLIEKSAQQGKAVDLTTADAVSKLLRASIIITSTLVVLETLGVNISGVLAFGGIGGIAVGFAAKDLLANFFGGLMVYLDRPFEIGDWVRSPDRNIEGTVEHIGWRLTRIRTFDKRPLYIPNATFTSIAVENPSRMSHRRIHETVGLRYTDASKVRAIVAEVEAMLRNHPAIDAGQTLMVNFNRFAASSLDFFIYTFTKTTDWKTYHQVKQDVLLKVYDIISAHGAEVAFPTSTIHIEDAPSPSIAGDRHA